MPDAAVDLSSAHETTDGSNTQLLYGSNVVSAVLFAKKRTCLRLFTFGESPQKNKILSMARAQSLDIIEVDNKGVLNNFTNNRPHNGIVVECTPLPEVSISALGNKETSWAPIKENSNPMKEDQVVVDAAKDQQQPLYVLLDEVTDPQNLGSIIRTAYFLGAKGVIMSRKNCASISPVVAKAASGAVELLPLYYIGSTVNFIKASKRNQWLVLASVGPKEQVSKRVDLSQLREIARNKPVCLVMGSEGTGLRTLVKRECSMAVSIPAATGVASVVDSLNVGSAAAVLLAAILL